MARSNKKAVEAKSEGQEAKNIERLNFNTTKEDADNFRDIADMEGKTFSELCNTLLRRHVELNKDLLDEYRAIKAKVRRIE